MCTTLCKSCPFRRDSTMPDDVLTPSTSTSLLAMTTGADQGCHTVKGDSKCAGAAQYRKGNPAFWGSREEMISRHTNLTVAEAKIFLDNQEMFLRMDEGDKFVMPSKVPFERRMEISGKRKELLSQISGQLADYAVAS